MPNIEKTIGVFTPSYPITAIATEAANNASNYLQGSGYRVKWGSLTGKRDFYRSGTAKERAEELNELIRDPKITCIMSSMGGMVSNAMLPYLDYDSFAAAPKPIIGHSDVSAILLGIYAKTGVTTYYGPNLVSSFGQKPPFLDFTLKCLEQTLYGELPYLCPTPTFFSDETTDWSVPVPEKACQANRWVAVLPGQAEGRLIGGNLNTITGIMGSPYMPKFQKGDILFLEDTEKFAAHAERYFTLLKLCGVFDKVGGIILGKHRQFDDQGSGRTPADILLEVLDGRKLPILAEVDCCHTIPMLTLPIGGEVRLDSERRQIVILKR